MNKYTIYCTEAQTKKALELGAPIKTIKKPQYSTGLIERVTAEQMLGWLEEKGFHFDFEYITMTCCMVQYNHEYINNPTCGSRKEATLAAIDAALEYLNNNKK